MDLFSYLEDYQTWVCAPCGAGIKPKHYLAHLTSKKALLRKDPIDPVSQCFRAPRASINALPDLPLRNGISCLKCSYVCASEKVMLNHCGENHSEGKRRPGRWKAVSCQRLFVSGSRSQYFEVVSPAELQEAEETMRRRSMAKTLSEADYIRIQTVEALEEGNRETRELDDIILDNVVQTEVSPWLEMTRWPRYLRGYSFGEVAPLAGPADPTSEPILVEFSNRLDRIVEEAHSSICNATVGPDCDGRVPYRVEPTVHVPQADAAVG
jgi:hypothetical protein